jgi:phospholipid/cholesterol/gamma-HCH transport system substrate-binding protein
MASPANHWKIGLFVIITVLLALGSLLVLGAQSMQTETVLYTTYFDESVQGLDTGSPVKFRGVLIGNVAEINIAEDRRHVEVKSALTVEEISRLGLAIEKKGEETMIGVPSELRMQLASAGITGVKYLSIDFFVVADNPPPELPFTVPPKYIPAAVSVMKNIEDSIVRAVNRIPEATEQAVDALLDQVEERKMPEQAEGTLVRTNLVLAQMEKTLNQLDVGEVSKDAREAIGQMSSMMVKMNVLIDRFGAKNGMYDSAQRTSNALGDIAQGAGGISADMKQTLRSVQEAAASIQRLTDALERDSDMLLKGRTRRAP